MAQMPQDMKAFNRELISQFRTSGGKVSLGPVTGEHLLLLTTTGRQTGRPHTVPIGYVADGDALIIFGSAAGSPREPDWVQNLRAHSEVSVELAGEQFAARAEITAGDDRQRAYDMWIEAFPHTADNEAKAGRQIPMIRLRRS